MTTKPRTIRIFISSPGDVADERDKARRVIEGLQRHYSGATLQPVLWEELALPATASFQESIDFILNQRPIDIAVFIIWSRLGSPLGAAFSRPDGVPYLSGTEREFDLMLAAFEQSGQQRPVILAYTRNDEGGFRQRFTDLSESRLEEMVAQRKLAETFIREQFRDAEGHNIRAYHSYREPISFAQRLHTHLRQTLEELLGVEAAPRWLNEPYRGLEFFDVPHADIFQGREEETCDLLQRLRDQEQAGCAFVVIVGSSGSGKSSLARAGVAAFLTRHSFEDSVKEWRAVVFIPGLSGNDLCTGLVRAMAEQLPELRSSATALDDIASGLAKDPVLTVRLSVNPAFSRAAEHGNGGIRVLLILDQMEELWTDRRISAADCERFLSAIEALARSGHIAVLATLRSDFYPHAQRVPEFLCLKGDRGHCDLLPPGTAALQRLITEPARLAGLRFERDERTGKTLDEVILQDASHDPSALPLLQYTLSELYHARDESTRMLTFAAYEKLGGVEGALGRRAADTFNRLSDEARQALPEILPLLVTVDVASEQTAVRRRAPLTELMGTPARKILTESLISARFLTTDRQGDIPIASLAHEALLRRWEQLADWVTANREYLRLRARVEQNQQRWDQQSRDPSLLLTPGLPLEEGRQLLASASTLLSEETAAYIRTSVTHHDLQQTRRRQRRRTIMSAMGVLTVLALAGGAVAWKNASDARSAAAMAVREQSKAERARETATNETARANQANDRNLTLLHRASMADFASGRNAWQEDFDAQRKGQRAVTIGGLSKWREAVAYFVRALELEPGNAMAAVWLHSVLLHRTHDVRDLTLREVQHEGTVFSASFSSDGATIVTASYEGTAQVWDSASGQPRGELLRHDDGVLCAAFSFDGSKVITGSKDKTARIWDAATGQSLGEPIQHESSVSIASFSPDGLKIVTATDKWPAVPSQSRVWNAATGQPLGEPMQHDGQINSANFSPDSSRVLTACEDKAARVWDANTGKMLGQPLLHARNVSSASYSPDGSKIVTGSWDATARIWDSVTGDPLGEPFRHEDKIFVASFSPDGTKVVTASLDNTARVWDVATGQPLGEPYEHESYVNNATFSPDGSIVVTASNDGNAQVWEVATGQQLGESVRHHRFVNIASFSPDGSRVVTAGWDNNVLVWDVGMRQELSEPLRHDGQVNVASFSNNGSKILTTAFGRIAPVWDVATGRAASTPIQRDYEVANASFSPDGSKVITATWDKSAQLWDANSGQPYGKPLRHDGEHFGATFSFDGTKVVTSIEWKTAQIWDAATGEPLGTPLQHENLINSVCFSADNSKVVTASWDDTAQVWNAATGQPLGEALRHQDHVNSASFSPDGTKVITASHESTARVWDAATGRSLGKPLQHAGYVNSASFSPDGTRIVTTSNDKAARIWDATTGRLIGEPLTHDDQNMFSTLTASFSPDSSKVVTASSDDTARVWNANTGQPLGEPFQHENDVSSASFSPDGSKIVTAAMDNTARLWDVSAPDEFQMITLVSPAVLDWARAVAGLRFNDDGELQIIPLAQRQTALAAAQLPPGPWTQLDQWLKTRGSNRKLSPTSARTLREVAERERDFGSSASLESALHYDSTVPLARLLLAEVLEKENETVPEADRDATVASRAAFLRRYDLDRLPPDATLWVRAAHVLRERPDAKVGLGPTAAIAGNEALKAARKAVALDPQLRAAQETLQQIEAEFPAAPPEVQ